MGVFTSFFARFVDQAIGRAQPVFPSFTQHAAEQHFGLVDLLQNRVFVASRQPLMAEGVAADLVAVFSHPAHQPFVALDLLADQKKGRFHAPLLQPFQQNGGGVRPRAVVKSQRHIFGQRFPGALVAHLCCAARRHRGAARLHSQQAQRSSRQQAHKCPVPSFCHSIRPFAIILSLSMPEGARNDTDSSCRLIV